MLGPSRVLSLYICLCETPFSFNLIPNYLSLILRYLLPILTILIAIDCQLIEAAPFVPEDTLPPLSAPPNEPMFRQRQELSPPVSKQINRDAICSSNSPYLTKDPEFEALFPPEKEDLMYPLHSRILPPNDKQYIPSINNSFRKAERERFVLLHWTSITQKYVLNWTSHSVRTICHNVFTQNHVCAMCSYLYGSPVSYAMIRSRGHNSVSLTARWLPCVV
jgi:hypothetical protein